MNKLMIWTGAALLAACGGEKFHVEGSVAGAADSVLYFEHVGLNGYALLDTVRLDGQGLAVITLPATLQKEAITLTLAAESGKQTPRIHEIRLCK